MAGQVQATELVEFGRSRSVRWRLHRARRSDSSGRQVENDGFSWCRPGDGLLRVPRQHVAEPGGSYSTEPRPCHTRRWRGGAAVWLLAARSPRPGSTRQCLPRQAQARRCPLAWEVRWRQIASSPWARPPCDGTGGIGGEREEVEEGEAGPRDGGCHGGSSGIDDVDCRESLGYKKRQGAVEHGVAAEHAAVNAMGVAGEHVVEPEHVAENMPGNELEHDAVPLEHGDSSSDAGFQAVDEGEDDVQSDWRRYGDEGVRNIMQRRVRARRV